MGEESTFLWCDKAPASSLPRRRIFYKSFTLPPAFAVESAVFLCYTEKRA